MKPESIAIGVAGVLGGLLMGWIIGSQYAGRPSSATLAGGSAPPAAAAAPPVGTTAGTTPLDESRVQALMADAESRSDDAGVRTELGNLYFDAGRYEEAISWYEASLQIDPDDVNVSTDLGVSYYYTNQPDRALAQFARSLEIDGAHAKTLLNLGIVRAFGKRDLEGAMDAWQLVISLAPDSPEGQAARQALDALQTVHADIGS